MADATAAATGIDVQDLPCGPLDEAQAKALFARFGVTPVRECVVRNAADAGRAARCESPRRDGVRTAYRPAGGCRMPRGINAISTQLTSRQAPSA